MQARYVILRLLLERGGNLVKVERVTGSDGHPDIVVSLDRGLIETTGKSVIQDFLLKLQVTICLLSPVDKGGVYIPQYFVFLRFLHLALLGDLRFINEVRNTSEKQTRFCRSCLWDTL